MVTLIVFGVLAAGSMARSPLYFPGLGIASARPWRDYHGFGVAIRGGVWLHWLQPDCRVLADALPRIVLSARLHLEPVTVVEASRECCPGHFSSPTNQARARHPRAIGPSHAVVVSSADFCSNPETAAAMASVTATTPGATDVPAKRGTRAPEPSVLPRGRRSSSTTPTTSFGATDSTSPRRTSVS